MGELLPARGVQGRVQHDRPVHLGQADALDTRQARGQNRAVDERAPSSLLRHRVEIRPQRGRVHRRVQRRGDSLPPSRQQHPDPVDPQTGSRRHRQLMTSGQDTWSARCGVIRTPGAAGGPGKPTGSNPGRAPRSDPTSAALGALVHQLCTAHLLRDLDDAAQVYPDSIWPVQIADALRALIGEANRAREHALAAIPDDVRDELLRRLRNGMLVGLSDTLSAGTRPGERKARLLLEVLRDRPADVLRFAHDLKVPPTSNQAERDLRPSKIQQKISGRLTSIARTQDRYTILGYVSTAAKHGLDKITALRDALTGRPWMPALPAPA